MRAATASIIGIGLVFAALVFGNYFYRSRQTDHCIRVVGSATSGFESDIVKWRITLGRSTGLDGTEAGFAMLSRDRLALISFLSGHGVTPEQLSTQPVNRSYTYDNDGRTTGCSFTQTFDVVSPNIDSIERLALNPDVLYQQGVGMQHSSLEYYLSKLPDIKKDLLAAATRDARDRAEEIAKNSGVRIGRVESARAGVFQITEPYSTDVSDYGIYSTATRRKNVTVTVTASFSLR